MKLKNEIVEFVKITKSCTGEDLKANVLTKTRDQNVTLLDSKLRELSADAYTSIEFEWDNLLVTGIEQLGSIKLNSKTMISPTSIFPPHVKSVVPDYKNKQLPTAVINRTRHRW